jgi:hypothetical protein
MPTITGMLRSAADTARADRVAHRLLMPWRSGTARSWVMLANPPVEMQTTT